MFVSLNHSQPPVDLNITSSNFFKGCLELLSLNEELISLYNFEETFQMNTNTDLPCSRSEGFYLFIEGYNLLTLCECIPCKITSCVKTGRGHPIRLNGQLMECTLMDQAMLRFCSKLRRATLRLNSISNLSRKTAFWCRSIETWDFLSFVWFVNFKHVLLS